MELRPSNLDNMSSLILECVTQNLQLTKVRFTTISSWFVFDNYLYNFRKRYNL